MLGALMGDIMGSRYEGPGWLDDPQAAPLWSADAQFTDDSVLTAAVAQWLLDGGALAYHLHGLGRRHLTRGFGQGFLTWLLTEPPGPAYQSWGNGAAMRVSPVAAWANTPEELLILARASALPTHDHVQGIRGAQAAAWAIRYAFENPHDSNALLSDIETRFGYRLAAFDPSAVRARGFELECEATVTSSVWAAAHGGSIEGAMRLILALGGDTDTMGAIAGPICEGLYGLSAETVAQLPRYFHPADGVWSTLARFYAHPRVAQRLATWGRLPPTPWPMAIGSPTLRLGRF